MDRRVPPLADYSVAMGLVAGFCSPHRCATLLDLALLVVVRIIVRFLLGLARDFDLDFIQVIATRYRARRI